MIEFRHTILKIALTTNRFCGKISVYISTRVKRKTVAVFVIISNKVKNLLAKETNKNRTFHSRNSSNQNKLLLSTRKVQVEKNC